MKGLKLLLWKNMRIQSRKKLLYAIEILAPVIFAIVMLTFRLAIGSNKVTKPQIYEAFKLKGNIPPVVKNCCQLIYYSPINSLTDQLVKGINEDFFKKQGLQYTFQGFPNKELLEQSYQESVMGFSGDLTGSSSPVLAGIIFENLVDSTLPGDIKYTMRFPSFQRTGYEAFEDRENFNPSWFTTSDYPLFVYSGPRSKNSVHGGFPGYYDEGFLYLQYAVDTSIAKLLLNESQIKDYDEYQLKLQRFPFPAYEDDVFLFLNELWIPFILAAAYIYPIMNITKEVVHEKSSRLKEFMKILGLSNWLHWTGWLVICFSALMLSSIISIILLKIRVRDDSAIFTHTDPSILFVIFAGLAWSVVGFCFLLSTLFSYEEGASTVGGFLWLLSYLPYNKFVIEYSSMTTLKKFSFNILWNPAMPTYSAFYFLTCRENVEIGGQWDNIWEGVMAHDKFHLGHAILLSFVNGSVYMLLAFYIELAFPGKYGVPLPWYFPFTKSYWTGSIESNGVEEQKSRENSKARKGTNAMLEKVPPNLKAGVEISKLTKVFGSKVAVSNLNLNMYEDQVTSLLGHNGAGKTTTMSILTGLIKPSSGTAFVNSFDIRKDMPAARASLGLCPQYNVLFDNLTVEEHLKFFSIIKGYEEAEAIEEVDRMLDVLGLQDKRHALSKTLSGGMKRKLSVGIAFSAGSKIVCLDEPTAGMDVGARRSTWDLIQSEKVGRTVILSTHYMQEADLLGDRIAIMSDGQLHCCGSSLFLKSQYGGDYNLTIVKQKNCDVNKLRNFIHGIIPAVIFCRDIGAELGCTLPVTHVEKFSVLFEELDKSKEELGIGSYGVSSTTMEDIFVRVGEAAKEQKTLRRGMKQKPLKKAPSSASIDMSMSMSQSMTTLYRDDDYKDDSKNFGLTLLCQQTWAMFIKKILTVFRNYNLVLLQTLIPCCIIAVCMYLAKSMPTIKATRPLHLQLGKFEIMDQTTVLLNCDRHSVICQRMQEEASNYYKIENVTNLSILSTLQAQGETSLKILVKDYMLGFEQKSENEKEIVGFFNNQPFHIPPVALNFLTNSLLNSFDIQHKIRVTNYPFAYTPLDEIKAPGSAFDSGYLLGLGMGFSLAFFSSSFVILLIGERVKRSKHLQLIAGVRMPIYWFTSFIVDAIIVVVTSTAMLLPLIWYEAKEFHTWDMKFKFVLFNSIFGWAMVLVAMFLSTICENAASAFARLTAFNSITGCLVLFTVMLMRCKEFKLTEYADTMYWIGLFFPTGCLALGTMDLGRHHRLHDYCKFMNSESFCVENPTSACCTQLQDSFYDWEALGIGRHIFFFCTTGLIFLILLILQESGIWRQIFIRFFNFNRHHQSRTSFSDTNGTMELADCDVMLESSRINQSIVSTLSQTDNLVLKNITKVYKKSLVAVDHLTVGVKKGEIFGLLGANGAGKTTTFEMLTGAIPITSGDAYINSYSVKYNLKKVHSFMGYCPQFDSAALDKLTGREILTIFGRLKGIKEKNIPLIIDQIAVTLLFQQFMDKRTGTYSGGNKRKLSTAMAMLGDPAIIFLDEPTAGMDPVARRHVWNAISSVRKSGTSVVITSHNMEECEALCSQIAIMVKGRFECLGSAQHLKSKLCQGYTLMAQLPFSGITKNQNLELTGSDDDSSGSDWEAVFDEFNEFMEDKFPGCTLKDTHPGFVEFQLTENTPWSKIFSCMEEAKKTFHIEAYSAGQVNLENVFFNIMQSHE